MKKNILIQLALVGSLACSLQADFVRDSANEVVLDTKTNLIWQDNNEAVGDTNKKTWADAITYCEALDLGGYSDWHLPNINELYNLADRTKYEPAFSSAFTNVESYFFHWSSTSKDSSNAWVVNFSYGHNSYSAIESTFNVRCVRSAD